MRFEFDPSGKVVVVEAGGEGVRSTRECLYDNSVASPLSPDLAPPGTDAFEVLFGEAAAAAPANEGR